MSKIDINTNLKILKSPFLLFSQIIFLLIFIAVFDFISILSFDFMQIEKSPSATFSYEELFFLGSLLIQLIGVVYLFLKWSSDYYYFEGHELLHKTGILFQNVHAFDLSKLDSISCQQNIFGRIFNFGTLTLYFSSQVFLLKQIPNPEHFTKIINRHKNSFSK